MACKKVEVTYTVVHKQTINWPEDEFEDFDYETLECNLDDHCGYVGDIIDLKVDGEDYDF